MTLSTADHFQAQQGEVSAGEPRDDRVKWRSGHPSVAVLLGGRIDRARDAVATSRRARIDVLEMERRFPAQVFDLSSLEHSRMFSRLAKLTGHSFALALKQAWKLRSFDVVYATGEDVGFPLALLYRLLPGRKPRLIVRMEQPTYGRTPSRRRIFERYVGLALPGVDALLCRTERHRRFMAERFGAARARLRFVGETTDPRFFDPLLPAPPLPDLDVPAGPFVFSAGLEMRDYPTLIEALRGTGVPLVIAAGSPWSHEVFDGHRGSSGADDDVRVCSLSPLQMRAHYAAAALVAVPVKPTMRACGMNVVLEAWAMGKPVIASATEGLESYLQDGVTGRLVPPGDAAALRSAVLDVLHHPDQAALLAQNGHDRVADELNLDHYLYAVSAIIEECISG